MKVLLWLLGVPLALLVALGLVLTALERVGLRRRGSRLERFEEDLVRALGLVRFQDEWVGKAEGLRVHLRLRGANVVCDVLAPRPLPFRFPSDEESGNYDEGHPMHDVLFPAVPPALRPGEAFVTGTGCGDHHLIALDGSQAAALGLALQGAAGALLRRCVRFPYDKLTRGGAHLEVSVEAEARRGAAALQGQVAYVRLRLEEAARALRAAAGALDEAGL